MSQAELLLTGNSASLASILVTPRGLPGWMGTKRKMWMLLGGGCLSPDALPRWCRQHRRKPHCKPSSGRQPRSCSCPEPQGRVAALLHWMDQHMPVFMVQLLPQREHKGAGDSYLPLKNVDVFLAKRMAITDFEHFPLRCVKHTAEIPSLLSTITNHWLSLYNLSNPRSYLQIHTTKGGESALSVMHRRKESKALPTAW